MRPPVVLVHGIDDTAALFGPMGRRLEAQGLLVCALSLTPNDGSAGIDELARQLAAFVDTPALAEQPFSLVGFSMGGLVSRYYLQRLGGLARVGRLITISSPHRGTWTAFLRHNAGARQMRPGSAFLQDLNHDASTLARCRFTSVWTPFDLMILPARNSILPEAGSSVHIPAVAHPCMVRDRRVIDLVIRLVSENQ